MASTRNEQGRSVTSETTKNHTRKRKTETTIVKYRINKFIKVGTWNVRGLNAEGMLKQLVREVKRYNFDLIALQETKQKKIV